MKLTPDQIYGNLFIDVQLSDIFEDSKTFVDMVPRYEVQYICDEYAISKIHPSFDLLNFVESHFEYPLQEASNFTTDKNQNIEQHIKKLWDVLIRKPDQSPAGSSLLDLPHPYIVPGGRFREIYYWDSYFTMLGLKTHGKSALIKSMVDNFAYLIEVYGHIPNGNRSYYLSRSQPPFFSHMVELLADIEGEKVYVNYIDVLDKEHEYWTKTKNRSIAISKLEPLPFEKYTLQRYYDNMETPRQESYKEDYHISQVKKSINQHLRSAAESGWDFSSRWQSDPMELTSIETTSILPLDLNCLLYHLEATLQKAYTIDNNIEVAEYYQDLASKRKKAIYKVLLDNEKGIFCDYHIDNRAVTDRYSLAMVYPLYIGIATPKIAKETSRWIEQKFLCAGGLTTTIQHTGQQWDAPNGWAPLQWIAVIGLQKYGYTDLANEIAHRWTTLIENVFKRTGKMMEKYNVLDLSLDAGGGEYPVQDGFGWTNGVYIALKDYLEKQ